MDNDTIRLLRECDAGVKMGINSIEEVLPKTESEKLEETLCRCKEKHETISDELKDLLKEKNDEGKDPSVIADAMSTLKTEVKMMIDPSDGTIASLMTDGCNMGVKSLSRYLNEYSHADDSAKSLCRRLIDLESDLAIDLRAYL